MDQKPDLNMESAGQTEKGEGSPYAPPDLSSSDGAGRLPLSPIGSPPFGGVAGFDSQGGYHGVGGHGGNQNRISGEQQAKKLHLMKEGYGVDPFRTGSNFSKG